VAVRQKMTLKPSLKKLGLVYHRTKWTAIKVHKLALDSVMLLNGFPDTVIAWWFGPFPRRLRTRVTKSSPVIRH
jgi:hypothetical protein